MRRSLLYTASVALVAVSCLGLAGCDTAATAGPAPVAKQVEAYRKALVSGKSSASKSAAPAAVPFAGWANLTGTVAFKGTAPTPAKLPNITPECSTHPNLDESVVVNGGMLANAVVFLVTKEPPVHESFAASAGNKVTLDNAKCRFEPHVVGLRTTQTLVLTNSDPFSHNSKGDCKANDPFNESLPKGDDASVPLKREESLPFQIGCNVHPWMGGWVVVRSNPYFGISDAQGNFSIPNLPAGREIELQLWHEKPALVKTAKIEGVKIDSKGRFKIKLEDGKDQKLAISIGS